MCLAVLTIRIRGFRADNIPDCVPASKIARSRGCRRGDRDHVASQVFEWLASEASVSCDDYCTLRWALPWAGGATAKTVDRALLCFHG